MIKLNKIFFLLIGVLLYSCSSAPIFTIKNNKLSVNQVQQTDTSSVYKNFSVLDTVIGIASYYAQPFNSRLTANGEIYDMYGLTAAHPTYPFDTIIRVTNLTNGKKTIIRINDRMPYNPTRIIDLSFGTAIKLDMLRDGIVKVKLEILRWGNK